MTQTFQKAVAHGANNGFKVELERAFAEALCCSLQARHGTFTA
jgi:hypothetical protein